LNVAGTSLSDFFHQAGTRPQRIGANSRAPCLSRRITSTVSFGAMFYCGWRLRGGPNILKNAYTSSQV
jgi:hypothetical protein